MTYPRVLPVGDRAVTVQLGPALDETTVRRARMLDLRLRDKGPEGVLEAVPTYAALMVIYDPRRLSFNELSLILMELAQGVEGGGEPGRLVEIEAVYDGEDLEEVARACALSEEAVVEIHAGRDYSVLMLGFSPGFPYMGFVDPRLQRPRRRTPRTRVPPGAVGVAGAQTGIYPRSLPGGWNLLGRTSSRLFDPRSPNPALLAPGDRVRFLPVASLGPPPKDEDTVYTGSGLEVVEAGLLTMVQDAGRAGLRRVAVPLAGFADGAAAEAANLCVGNAPDAPLLEICGPGLQIRFDKTSFVAICGARVLAHLERGDLGGRSMPMPMNAAVRVRAGNVLTITAFEEGLRAWVAVAGLQAPKVLGSASVDLGSGLLRALRAGDRLDLGVFDPDRVRREGVVTPGRPGEVRIILGPQADHFDSSTIEIFLASTWRVGLDSDRVGARLDGPRLPHSGPSEIVSDGMVPGCIQVPPDGRPIVMLSDCPTTGGYPKIGCVVRSDLAAVSGAIPGRDTVRFVSVDLQSLQATGGFSG